MSARVCSGCGAPLTHASPEQQILTCHFCGAEQDVARPPPPPAPYVPPAPRWHISPELLREDKPPPRVESAWSKPDNWLFGFLFVGGLVIGLAGVVSGILAKSRRHEAAAAKAAISARSAVPSILTPTTLAMAPLTEWKTLGWTPLDAPGMTGDYGAFDLLANFDWASRIATAWSPDAKLWRINADGHSPDGTFDLTPGGGRDDVLLEYNSASKGDLDLDIELHHPRGASAGGPGAHIDVSVSDHRDTTTRVPLATPKCPLSRVLPLLSSASKLKRPEHGWSLGLAQNGSKSYWFVTYLAPGKMTINGPQDVTVEDYVNAVTCAIEHLK